MTTWKSQMISPVNDLLGAPLLRKQFELLSDHGVIKKAVLRATALGIYELYINGKPVGNDVLSPGWTAYEWRLRYRDYDVTKFLVSTNILGVQLGNGWYRGCLAFTGANAFYGKRLGFFGQLDIEYTDGFTQTIATDTTWQTAPSETLTNDLYNGQTMDARQQQNDWLLPDFDDNTWSNVEETSFDTGRLVPSAGPAVVRHETIRPVKVWKSPSGKTLIDFGQNLVGWVRLTVQGNAGTVITIRHAEVLENDELSTRPLRTAQATDRFILSGNKDTFEPTMTFHGFRYVEVSGWPGKPKKSDFRAVIVHSDLRRTGHFECSNELLNKLHHNVLWSMRGNFLGIPTDCPQRDERLGWTGDISVFAPTAAFLYDCKDFLQEWLCDLAIEQQHADGVVPSVAPNVLKYIDKSSDLNTATTAIWGDAAVWVPWALWEAYGDKKILEQQYASMVAHATKVETALSTDGLWDSGFQFGDWLDPDAPPDDPGAAKANPHVVATACAYRTMTLIARSAKLLQKSADATHFSEIADKVKTGFNRHYVKEGVAITSDCPTVYALAIFFELLNDDQLQQAGDRLANLVKEYKYKIATGFAGTPYVTWALTKTRHTDVAYKLLLQEDCPSWLYPVKMGATTIWERWDSMLPDGSINPGEMTSFNHYALGSIADWMHKVIGGIAPLEPGYTSLQIAPKPGENLSWAKTSLATVKGTIAVEWNVSDKTLIVKASIPEGVHAIVELPGLKKEVAHGDHVFTSVVNDYV